MEGTDVSSTLTAPALTLLRAMTGDANAAFRPGQLEAIQATVAQRRRALVVQRTGWGKSAVLVAGPSATPSPTS